MVDRTVNRLRDIVDAVNQIDILLTGKTLDDVQTDRVVRAAFERFLEILSEVSRHVVATSDISSTSKLRKPLQLPPERWTADRISLFLSA